MRNVTLSAIFLFLIASLPGRDARAQSTPFLTHEETRMLINEISGDRAFGHIRWLTHWARETGSEDYFKAADYIVQAAKDAGLEDVKFIRQPVEGSAPAYNARSAELWMVEPVEVKLADIGDQVLYLARNSWDADVTAELIWAGDGSEKALEGLDVQGKIVLTSGQPSAAVRNAVWRKGAVGVVSYPLGQDKSRLDHPDQIAWTRIPMPQEGQKGTFAFVLPTRKGESLREILRTDGEQDIFRTGRFTKGGHIVVHAKVDTDFSAGHAETGFVEGWIRGTRYHDQQIVLTSHIQEEATSANDNASGMGNMLEMARAFTRLIREGKMKRPLRDIRFWWADEIYSENRYLRDNPGEAKKILANINQDMVGARQSMGDRIQRLIFNPHSRTSYLDTLLESVGNYVIQTNTYYLAAHRGRPWPTGNKMSIYSTQGSREGFHALLVPYFDSSDHRVFVEGVFGIPAVGLINMDDELIHSSDDDLANVDPTQLARNNFIVAALTHILAAAEPSDVPLLAAETYALGCRRLARDLGTAAALLKEGDGGAARVAGWKDAGILIEQGIARERRALDSVGIFASGDPKAAGAIDSFAGRLGDRGKEASGILADMYEAEYGEKPAPVRLSEEEAEAGRKIPANVADVDAYFTHRGKAHFDGKMQGLMRDETYNFVDGKRSYYDIYKAVRAESLVHGEWYYGPVSLADVVALLDAAVEVKALILK